MTVLVVLLCVVCVALSVVLVLTVRSSFENLAQKVLDARTEKLKTEGKDQLAQIVAPLLNDIRAFREKIASSDIESAKTSTELKNRIEALVSQTNAVSAQANNLADAIRGDSQATGEWGEIQLRRVLEAAGLREPESFSYQETFEDDETGRKSSRTDFVVKLPGDRSLIIDSKNTSEGMFRLQEAKTAEAKRAAVEAILASVRGHVDEIVKADYPSVVPKAFPTVLMYIPIEEVYQIAMRGQVSVSGQKEFLRAYAGRKNVVIVNSASVIPVVRLVEMMWTVERSEKNKEAIIAAAQELLNRTNDFLEHFAAVGAAFEKASAEYEAAKKRLNEGNEGHTIAKAAANLIKLGTPTKRNRRGGKKIVLTESIEKALEEDGAQAPEDGAKEGDGA